MVGVLEYVVCGGLEQEQEQLFVEVMGRTGYRRDGGGRGCCGPICAPWGWPQLEGRRG